MDGQTLEMVLKLVIFLPFVIFLVYLSLKYGGSKLQNLQNGRLIHIVERVQISKDNSLFVAKVGDKAYLMSSATGSIEILKELSEEEVKNAESKEIIPKVDNFKELCSLFKNKIYNKKVGKHEEKDFN